MQELFDSITNKLDQVYHEAFKNNELSVLDKVVELDDLVDELKTLLISKKLLSQNPEC